MSEWLDPRWEWVEIWRFGEVNPVHVRGRCNHLDLVPVEAGGEVVAHLCLTCDQQLPGATP